MADDRAEERRVVLVVLRLREELVGELRLELLVRLPDEPLDQQEFRPASHCEPAVAKNCCGLGVLPIVHDVLQNIEVAASGHFIEKTCRDDRAAPGQSRFGEAVYGPARRARQIGQRALQRRVGGEKAGQ